MKNNMQTNKNQQTQAETHHPQKNYLNYINFQSTTAQKTRHSDTPKEPEQVATYPINVSQHPRISSNNSSNPINRNAYLTSTHDPRRDPPKQHLSRNSSHKDPFASRQSQDHINNQAQFLRNSSKTNPQGFSRHSGDLDNSYKPPQYGTESVPVGSPNYSKTVDLGSIKSHQLESSSHLSPEFDDLKQKLNYLEVIQQSLNDFQSSRSASNLKQLNQDNRLLMLGVFEQINKLKQSRQRRALNDCVSESDNFSEEGYSVDDRSDSRSNSIHNKSDKRRYMEGLSRSRQKYRAKDKEVELQKRTTDKLKEQYERQLNKLNSKQESELEKVCISIQKQQDEIKKLRDANEELAKKVTSLPFHKQWQIMCVEAEGAKKARVKIEDQIVKRKQKLNEVLQSSRKTPVRSEETSANQKEEENKGRQSSTQKRRLPVMPSIKIPPSPANRPQNLTGSNNTILDSSQKPPISESRSKSSNRFNTSN